VHVVDIDECVSSPCQHGGRCTTPHLDMHTCECIVGYAGHVCEHGK